MSLVARRLGATISPPCLSIEYIQKGKRRRRSIPLRRLRHSQLPSDIDGAISDLYKSHEEYLERIPRQQVERMVRKIAEHVRARLHAQSLALSVPPPSSVSVRRAPRISENTATKWNDLDDLDDLLHSDSDDGPLRKEQQQQQDERGDEEGDTSGEDTSLEEEEEEEEENLNALSDAQLARRKQEMDKLFNANKISQSSSAFEYDRQVEFNPEKESGWDESSGNSQSGQSEHSEEIQEDILHFDSDDNGNASDHSIEEW